MDTLKAFALGEMARKRGDKQMIFDWHKAAQLIKERNPSLASAGLRSDWEYTGDSIYSKDTGPITTGNYTYLSSNWAVPELDLDGDIIECYVDQDNNPEGWDSSTLWPESALKILNSK
jgi:hypothetical protein